ncbi:hypothetical protein BpHYR1_045506 [Brachionus plicatilis]|uniref:Uncharacterized protein n=1 Tax=Brachionus plicatilis TaxID=10195 RepID=A0A3M7QGM2_BRAPC|nr:hypothetical protein BpHYR1_045506 [Brachionus plicatilis]
MLSIVTITITTKILWFTDITFKIPGNNLNFTNMSGKMLARLKIFSLNDAKRKNYLALPIIEKMILEYKIFLDGSLVYKITSLSKHFLNI